jgi:hypothetical protein
LSCIRSEIPCNYSQRGLIEAENARDASTLQQLRSLPPSEASRLLDTIRTHEDKGSVEPDPATTSVLWSYVPTNSNTIEFELMVRHPVSYPPLFPLEAATLPLESLLRPSRIAVTRYGTDR